MNIAMLCAALGYCVGVIAGIIVVACILAAHRPPRRHLNREERAGTFERSQFAALLK